MNAKHLIKGFLRMAAMLAALSIPASAALHSFKLTLPEKPTAGSEMTVKVTALNEQGKKESVSQKIKLRFECRAESVEKEVTLTKGEGSVPVLLNYVKPYIATMTDGNAAHEIFTTTDVEVRQ